MSASVDLETVYLPSEDVVAREIEGEILIVPLTPRGLDMEDAIYTLNETGRAVWGLLDGRNTVREVVHRLSAEYDSPEGDIERDVRGMLQEMLARRIVQEASGG